MWVPLNEIESTSVKAAHHAGYGWALAEEAGAAARWLAMRGLPFLRPLTVGVLRHMHKLESLDSARRLGTSFGPSAPSRRLGPVSVLTALSEEILVLPKPSGELSLRSIAAPVFVLPVLARLSKRYDAPLLVRWPGAAIDCRAGEIIAGPASRPALECVCAEWFTVSRRAEPEPGCPTSLRHQGAELDDGLWRELKLLADRSYVPEGETSRLRGSGAGRGDAD